MLLGMLGVREASRYFYIYTMPQKLFGSSGYDTKTFCSLLVLRCTQVAREAEGVEMRDGLKTTI